MDFRSPFSRFSIDFCRILFYDEREHHKSFLKMPFMPLMIKKERKVEDNCHGWVYNANFLGGLGAFSAETGISEEWNFTFRKQFFFF